MKVSIIVPVYNAEKYITKCIDSLLNQTYNNIEIIAIDDGSTDSSYNILKSYKDKIITIHQKNHGVSYSRNVGIKKATGEYITFVDVDDWIDLDMIEKLYQQTEDGKIDIIRCGYIREYSDHQESFIISNKKIKITQNKSIIYNKFLNNYDLASPCGQLIRKSCIKKLFREDIKVGEDYLFNLDVYTNAVSFVLLSNCYYHYLYNDNSATTSISYDIIYKRCEDSIIVYSYLFDYIKKWDYDSKENIQLVNYRIIKELNMKLISLFKNNDKLSKEKKKIIFEFFNNINIKKIRKELQLKTIIKNINIYSLFILCIKYKVSFLYFLLGNTFYKTIYKIKKV